MKIKFKTKIPSPHLLSIYLHVIEMLKIIVEDNGKLYSVCLLLNSPPSRGSSYALFINRL